MERKYNAFISYRHAEADIKIASEIQTQLERFKIPPEIQKKTGVKRFERVFRDKEELPITSDLNDDIDIALKNSEHLIVICSVRTGESVWVQKEIETFLKYHSKKNIFTVLVDGEPGDVIPGILLHDTVTRKLADGTEETREEIIEPLSCDYRMGIKKARKVELPRLVASMLGVSYDEIVQRRRQYIRRRNAMIGSVCAVMAAGAIGYLSWSLFQIGKNYDLAQFNYKLAQENYALAQANYETAQANYLEALRNQSRFLASESGELLSEHDKVGALQLALAALPSEEKDRPVTIEAEYALSNALSSYFAPGYGLIEPVWKYDAGFEIQEFKIIDDHKYMIMIDVAGNVVAWDLAGHNVACTYEPGAYDIIYAYDGRLFISYSDRIVCFDTDLETILWTAELDSDHSVNRGDKTLQISYETDELFYGGTDYITVFDASNGNIKEDHCLFDEIAYESEDGLSLFSFLMTNMAISSDGRFVDAEMSINFGERCIAVLDRTENSWNILDCECDYIQTRRFSEDDKLILTYSDNTSAESFSIGSGQNLMNSIRHISMFDPVTAETIWTCDVPFMVMGYETDIKFCDYTYDAYSDPVPAVLVLFSDKCVFIEEATGNLLAEKEFPSEYIDSYIAVSGKGIIILLKSGQYVFLALNSPDTYMTVDDYFLSGVTGSSVFPSENGDNVFLIGYGKSVVEYDTGYYDRDVVIPEDVPNRVNTKDSFVLGDKILVFDDKTNLYCVDIDDAALVWSEALGDSWKELEFLSAGEDGYVYLWGNPKDSDSVLAKAIARLDITDGSIEKMCVISDYSSTNSDMENGKVWWMGAAGSQALKCFDISSGEELSLELEGYNDRFVDATGIDVSSDGKYALLYDDNEWNGACTILVDLSTGASFTTDYDLLGYVCWSPDSDRYIVGSNSAVYMCDSMGKPLVTISEGGEEIVEASPGRFGVVVLYTSGRIVLYDYDGNVINSETISLSRTAYASITSFDYYGDDLFVDVDGTVTVIEMNAFRKRAVIVGLLGYYEEGERFVVRTPSSSSAPSSVVMFDRKTVDELISEGYEYLGSTVMDDEMKTRYGIE